MALRYNKWWATDFAFDPIDVEFGPLYFPGSEGEEYVPPAWDAVSFDWGPTAYTAPEWYAVNFSMALGVSDAQTIYAEGFDVGSVGTPVYVSWRRFLEPTSIEFTEAFGAVGFIDRKIKNFDFTSAYTPPSWSAVSFAFGGSDGELFAVGIDASAFGDASVDNFNRNLLASGFDASSFGTALVTKPLSIAPTGIYQFKFGFAPDGDGFISHLDRSLSPSSIAQAAYGTALVTNFNREVDLAGRSIVGDYGTPLVAYKLREIFPVYIYSYATGYPRIGGTQWLVPEGIDATLWGTTYVHDNRQFPEPQGFDAAAYGTAELTRSPRLLEPPGIVLRDILPSEQWGTAVVWNLRQYVRQLFDVTPSDGGVFGDPIWMQVENRNRLIHTYGHKDSVVPGLAKVDNKAVPVLPSGIEGEFGDALVAYRIRNVYPEAMEPQWFSPYTAVYNNLRPVYPSGFAQDAFGTPSFQNTRRYYTLVGYDSALYGTPFVSYAVRYVATPLGPESTFGYHDVQLGTRYIAPPSIDAFGTSAPFVEERFTVFAPSSILANRMGLEHYVLNVTPEVTPQGVVMTEWGDNHVFLQYRFVYPDGVDQTLWGGNAISDRDRSLAPAGASALRMGTGHSVRNDSPDPPWPRDLGPTAFIATLFGQPAVRSNDIVPAGLAATLWGNTTVLFLGAYPAGIGPVVDAIPAPWVKGPQYVTVTAIKAPDDPSSSLGRTVHDLKPRTIWATFDVTDQALSNHEGEWELMDHYLIPDDTGARPTFGRPDVTLSLRWIEQYPMAVTTYGSPTVDLRNRRIYPAGIKPKPLGIPSIPFARTLRDVGVGAAGAIGEHSLENQHRAIGAIGLEPPEISEQHYVDFFNRVLLPVGLDAFTSTGQHRLHPPEPIVPVGLDATLYGDTFVSNWLRWVTPEGFDASDLGESPGSFRDRMTVTRGSGGSVRPRQIPPSGAGTPTLTRTNPTTHQDIFTAA